MLREGSQDRKELQFSTASEEPASPPCAAREPLGTFARAIVVDDSGHPVREALQYVVSLAIHAVLIGMLSILPLFFLKELHPYLLTRAVVVTPVPPSNPLDLHSRPSAARPLFQPALFASGLSVPVFRSRNVSAAAPCRAPQIEPIPSGVNGGIDNLFGDLLSVSPPLVVPVFPPPGQFVRVGGDVQGSRLIRGVSLVYPAVAKAMRIFGKVILEAIIDPQGNVKSVRGVSGPPLLVAEAAKAVAREKFAPVLLDGQPTQSGLTVEVTFRLFDGESWLH